MVIKTKNEKRDKQTQRSLELVQPTAEVKHKGKVVRITKVKPFPVQYPTGEYISRMLIDVYNSGSEKLQVNHGLLKPGCGVPGGDHGPHDEIYIAFNGQALLNLDYKEYVIQRGDIVFIPAHTFHSVKNLSKTEDFEFITVWPGQPAPGGNDIYEMRQRQWGTTYLEVDE